MFIGPRAKVTQWSVFIYIYSFYFQYRSDFNTLFKEQSTENYFLERWRKLRPKITETLINEIDLPKYSEKRALLGILNQSRVQEVDESKILG